MLEQAYAEELQPMEGTLGATHAIPWEAPMLEWERSMRRKVLHVLCHVFAYPFVNNF